MSVRNEFAKALGDKTGPSSSASGGPNGAAAGSGRRVVRFNENAATLLQQQLKSQKEKQQKKDDKKAVAAASAVAAGGVPLQSAAASVAESPDSLFSKLFNWNSSSSTTAATAAAVATAAATTAAVLSATSEGKDASKTVGAAAGTGPAAAAPVSVDAIKTEMSKREALARQLGRSHASISGPELDTIARDLSWHELPPCPIHGMTLAEQGLYDSDVGRFLDVDDLRDLINQTGRLEAETNLQADSRLGITAWRRVTELSINAGIVTAGLVIGWFWGLKFWQGYAQAFPRRSLLLKHWHLRRNPDMPSIAIEELCQKHRVLFTMTNLRPMSFLAFGVCGVGMLIFGEISRRRKDDFRDVNKFIMQRGQHYEGAMKWLFAVYYHHPAYKDAAASRNSRSLVQSDTWHPKMDDKTPNLNSRRGAWEDQFPNR